MSIKHLFQRSCALCLIEPTRIARVPTITNGTRDVADGAARNGVDRSLSTSDESPAAGGSDGPDIRTGAHADRGQSLVEFAMVLPILTILIFGVIDFSLGLRSYISLTNATREGARFAAVGNAPGSFPADCDGTTNTTTIGRVCVAMDGLDLNNIDSLSVTYPNGQSPGNSVVVSVEYTHHFVTPLADLASFFTGGSFPDTITLSTSSDMRLE